MTMLRLFLVEPVRKLRCSIRLQSTSQKSAFLDAASKYVSAHGWTEEALAKGAKELGLSTASHGQYSPVDLVEHVATKNLEELSAMIDERAEELASLTSWRHRLELAIEMRLGLSAQWHQHRAQALGLMMTTTSLEEPPAIRALARVGDELARATLVEGEQMETTRWRARRAAAAGAYGIVEARALTDTSHDLKDTVAFSKKVVAALSDASEAPDALKDAIQAGTMAAKSLGGAALGFLPPQAVGALPQLLGIFGSRASSTLSFFFDSTLDRLLQALPPSPVPKPPQAPSPVEEVATMEAEVIVTPPDDEKVDATVVDPVPADDTSSSDAVEKKTPTP